MKVGEWVTIRNQTMGGKDVVEGTAVVKELQYGDEWADGGMAAVEFTDEPGVHYNRRVWDKDIVKTEG